MVHSTPRSVAAAAVFALGGSLGASGIATAVAAGASASSTVTRYAPQTTNVRTGPSVSYGRVGTVTAGTKITGTLSNGWVKITSPAQYAGRYISNSVLTSAPALKVTRYTTPPGSTNVRSGPSTSTSRVGSLPANTKITGTLSNGWVKITSPAQYAGRYVSNSVLTSTPPSGGNTTPTPPPATGETPAWAGYSVTYVRDSSGRALSRIPVNTKVTGKIANSSLFLIQGGPYSGKYIRNYDLLWSNPATYGPSASGSNIAPTGQSVTRYVVTNLDPAVARSAPTTHSAAVGSIAKGTALKGRYVNSDWFKITSGSHSGQYVTSALLYATNNMTDYNGNMKKADMCALGSWSQTAWAPTVTRYLACPAAKSFNEMNAAFRKQYGYDLKIEESYRDLKMQQMYIRFLGYPRAAMPGTSNHGFGTAVDLESTDSAAQAGTPYHTGFGGTYDRWLTAHGKEYGWDRPAYLDPSGNNPESWHYNYIG